MSYQKEKLIDEYNENVETSNSITIKYLHKNDNNGDIEETIKASKQELAEQIALCLDTLLLLRQIEKEIQKEPPKPKNTNQIEYDF